MARILCALAVSLAALALVLPAVADGGGRSGRGVVVSVSSSQIVVRSPQGVVHCAVTGDSPSLAGFAAGDRVAIGCARSANGLVLKKLAHLTGDRTTPPPTTTSSTTTGDDPGDTSIDFGGTVTAVSATSISLRDGGRDVTCTVGSSSPSLTGVQVGSHAHVTCTAGVLATFRAVSAPTTPPNTPTKPAPTPPPAPAGVVYAATGTVSALSSTSISVLNAENGQLTCTIGTSSPSLGDVHQGDRVRLGCDAQHVLVAVGRP